jgi:hypothetical protein
VSAPPNDERRPVGIGATSPESLAANQPSDSVRRRRAAALRCEPLQDTNVRDPWMFTPSASRRSLEASRAAWEHLRFCGLLDADGFVAGVLRGLGGAS